MKAFELQGTVTLNNQDANNKIDETSERMEALHTTLMNAMETVGKWALKFASSMAVAVTATKAALVKIVSENTAAMDSIDKASKRVGMSTKSYQEWNYVLQQSGTSMGQMESGMMTLVKRMKEVQDGNATTKAWFDKMGVAATDSEGNLRDVAVVFEEIIAAMTVMKGDKMTTADFFFGGSGQQLQYLLDTSYADIVALKKEANDLGLILTDEQIAAGVEFVNTSKTLKSAFGTIGHDITNALLPALQQFYDFLLTKFPTIKEEFVNGFLPALKDVVEGCLGIIQALLDPDGEMKLEENIEKMVDGIVSIVSRLAEHAPMLVDGIVKLFNALLPHVDDLVKALVPLVTAILDGIISHLPSILDSLSVASYDIIKSLLEPIGLGFLLPDRKTIEAEHEAARANSGEGNPYLDYDGRGGPFKALTPDPSEDAAADAEHIRELFGHIDYSTLKYYGYNQDDIMQMPDEELVEWYRWQNKGAINRAAGGFTSTYGLTMPYMDEDGYIRFNMNPRGDEKPLFDLFDYWGNDLNPVYTTKHNEGVTKQIEDDPYGVRPYQKEYGDDWFDLWYEKNKDTIDPEDLDYVLDKYDVPTFGNAMPGFGDGMMGALSAFFPGGKGFMGGDMTPLTTQLASLNAKLDTVINQQAQGKTIVLNTGALVGNIGGAMDKFLGNTVLNKTRTGGVNV